MFHILYQDKQFLRPKQVPVIDYEEEFFYFT